ncbi:MAG: mRNA surveillance protein pelota [Candidatus Hodarchaeales archaeon]
MHILKKDLKNNQVVLRIENPNDLYVLSNLILIGDKIISKTSRRVRRSGTEGRSGEESQRITMTIGIQVEDFAFHDSEVSNRLRVKGKIFRGPEQYVSLGSYHTLNLELSQVVTIIKSEWTRYYLQLLKEAEEASKKPKICLIAIEKSEVCIGLLDNFQLQVVAHEKSHILRKKGKEKTRSTQIVQFFDKIADILERRILVETKNIIIGGPGFIKEQLASFLKDKYKKEEINIVITGSLSGGNRVGLNELMQDEMVDKLASDFRIFEEKRFLDDFLKRLNQGNHDISYGFSNLVKLSETGAIESLIIIDSLLRGEGSISSEDVKNLLKQVEKTRGKILIIPRHSENAKVLQTFGGIVALLRYSIEWD